MHGAQETLKLVNTTLKHFQIISYFIFYNQLRNENFQKGGEGLLGGVETSLDAV